MYDAHIKTSQGEPKLMVSHAVRKFWILHVQVLTERIYSKCVVRARFAAKTLTQIICPSSESIPVALFWHAALTTQAL